MSMSMILSDTILVCPRADYLLNSTQLRTNLSKLFIDTIADVSLQSAQDVLLNAYLGTVRLFSFKIKSS